MSARAASVVRVARGFVVLGAVVSIAACEGTIGPRDRVDAFVEPIEPDAAVAPLDAHFVFDAPDLDAPLPDAFVVRPDAWMGMDAYMTPGTDAFWGTCSSGGRMGTCMPMSLCAGMSVRGLCPGPADI